ncbi:MAG: hypothetical protein ACKO14_08045, partial [Armatimonadota bacterium]
MKASEPRHCLPSVGKVIELLQAQGVYHIQMTSIVRSVIERHRIAVIADTALTIPTTAICDEVIDHIVETSTVMTRVINATGVLLHTNLGRAVLSESAIRALTNAVSTADVEFD